MYNPQCRFDLQFVNKNIGFDEVFVVIKNIPTMITEISPFIRDNNIPPNIANKIIFVTSKLNNDAKMNYKSVIAIHFPK